MLREAIYAIWMLLLDVAIWMLLLDAARWKMMMELQLRQAALSTNDLTAC